MAQTETKKLDNGDLFPAITLSLVDGASLTLPEAVSGQWCVFQVYRGHW